MQKSKITVQGRLKMLSVQKIKYNTKFYKLCQRFLANQTSVLNQENLTQKQKEIMARGLPKQKPINGVKQIIMVASGKGGVGKSTTSVNLAVALKIIEPAKSVGLLDADVFGPSIPLMMNIDESPTLNKNNQMEPPENYGIKCMSMGFLIDKKSPVIWRGLMVMSALEKLIRQVTWGPLDYLIIDTPPGTGDTHLSLIQNLPITGVLLVTTPQQAAVQVTIRGAAMFKKVNIPIAGVVANMTSLQCPNCQNQISLFKYQSEKFEKELGIKTLSEIPLDENIMESSDTGKPVVLTNSNSLSAKAYFEVAKKISEFLRKQSINVG